MKDTNSETCQGRARFQQNRDENCHQVSFPARQSAKGYSRHSDRNISLFVLLQLKSFKLMSTYRIKIEIIQQT